MNPNIKPSIRFYTSSEKSDLYVLCIYDQYVSSFLLYYIIVVISVGKSFHNGCTKYL